MLVTMAYMYVCSGICAASPSDCCKCCVDKDGCHGPECDHKGEKKSNDCQSAHLSFFKVLGQYHYQDNNNVKIPTVVAFVRYGHTAFQPISLNTSELVFNNHSPPPKIGIRVKIRSFQI